MWIDSTASLLKNADPRVTILVCGVLGVCAWQAGAVGVAVYGLGAAVACAALSREDRALLRDLRVAGVFVVFWMAVHFALDSLGWIGEQGIIPPLADRLGAAGLLGMRLAVLMAVGFALARSASPRRMGLALSWFLRPVLRGHAWRAALGLALMIHFLPLAREVLDRARLSVRLRAPRVSAWKRFLLVPQVALRALSRLTWSQAVAVAARGLDRPAAWQGTWPPNDGHWATGAAVGLVCVLLALV